MTRRAPGYQAEARIWPAARRPSDGCDAYVVPGCTGRTATGYEHGHRHRSGAPPRPDRHGRPDSPPWLPGVRDGHWDHLDRDVPPWALVVVTSPAGRGLSWPDPAFRRADG